MHKRDLCRLAVAGWVSLSITFVYCVETAKNTATVDMETVLPKLSNGAIFNDRKWPITQISRPQYYSTSNVNSRFGINIAVVPAPIENFFYFNDPSFISTVIVVSQ